MADSTLPRSGGLLGVVERLGNRLPDPLLLFVLATALVVVISALGSGLGWSVQPVRPQMVSNVGAAGPRVALVAAGEPIRPRSLATGEGIYWLGANLVRNFINFPPLGVVLVCMLGIGLAEHTGMFTAAMRYLGGVVPAPALTPAVIMLGFLSHMAADSGFVVLPPLAAALYAASGRSPIVGAAVAYAAVAGGFSANLMVSASDALVAPLSERGARVLDPSYTVQITCNWYFLAAAAVMLTLVGWLVTSRIVEPRVGRDGGQSGCEETAAVSALEGRGLRVALIAGVLTLAGIVALALVPGAPLNGPMPAPAPPFGPIPASGTGGVTGALQPRWSQAIVALIFVGFLVPGLAYGLAARTLRSLGEVSTAFVKAMVSMAPVVAMYFFAAQFIECFKFSQLDAMLAYTGGRALVAWSLPVPLLLVGLIVIVLAINLLIPSMSAKWAALSTILVPMLMMAGIAPELTQAAYRVGDSVTNPVTPFSPYVIIPLAVLQRYRKDAGLGTLFSLTLPYAAAFFLSWTALLLVWVWLRLPLGPGAPLWYAPGAG